MATVTLVNRKGGCGASSLVSHLSGPLVAALRAKHGADARLLIIDADPLCGTSSLLVGDELGDRAATVATVLAGQRRLPDAAIALDGPTSPLDEPQSAARAGINLLPGSANVTVRFPDPDRLIVLRELIAAAPGRDVQMVLIDAGAAAGDLGESALVAADHIAAVTLPATLDIRGVDMLEHKTELIRRRFPQAQPVGTVLVNRYDRAHRSDRDAVTELERRFGERLAHPLVPYSAAIKQANAVGLPLSALAPLPSARLTEVFEQLAAVLIDRLNSHDSTIGRTEA